MEFQQIYIKKDVTLFSNQVENVKALVRRRRALLTDHVGAGKTLSILYAFSYLKEKGKLSTLLVMTPKSAYEKKVWQKDIEKFTTLKCIDLDTLSKRVEGNFASLNKLLSYYNVVYAKHSHVKQLLPLVEEICKYPNMMLCVDEIHAMKNPSSKMTMLFKIAASNVRNFWGVTGTAVSKNLEDAYNIINLIYPWYLGSFPTFRDTYCTTRERVIGRVNGKVRKVLEITGVRDEQALQDKLSGLVISGEAFANLKFHYLDYEMSSQEATIYRRVANGIDLNETMTSEDWIKQIMAGPEEETRPIKEVERYSSRFIYLQTAADGVLSSIGTQDRLGGVKTTMLINKLKEITSKGQSVLVYFDFLASLEVVKKMIAASNIRAKVLENTGQVSLKEGDLTEGGCKYIPHIVLCTRAASESASYYFINNVIFFHIPTVPSTFVQMNGRITRKNTLFPDDLNCYIFRCDGIDLYKLLVVSSKTKQMEIVQNSKELNIPDDYKTVMERKDALEKAKKVLLWRK